MGDSDVMGLDYLSFILVGIGALVWLYHGVTTASPDILPVVPAMLERVTFVVVGIAGVLDLLGFTGGYGLLSDDRDMMQ